MQELTRARRYVLTFTTGLGVGTSPITQAIAFNVPRGGRIIGITGAGLGFSGPSDGDNRNGVIIDISAQNGEGYTTGPTLGSAVLGTGERPYNLHDSPWAIGANQTLTVTLQDVSNTGLSRFDTVFWVVETV